MSNMVTRCPKCATSFRITSAQLQSAKGAVRCGSCLHIFKAQDHLVTGAASARTQRPTPAPAPLSSARPAETRPSVAQPTAQAPLKPTTPAVKPAPAATPTTAAPAAAKPTPSAASSTEQTPASPPAEEGKLTFSQEDINRELALSGDDDFLISDDMDVPEEPEERSDYEFDGFLDLENLPKQTGSLFDREIRQTEPEEDEIDPDESWAMELLEEADEEINLSARRAEKEERRQEKEEFNSEEPSTDLDVNEEMPEADAPRTSSVPFKGPIFNIVAEKSDTLEEAEEIHAQPYRDDQLYQQAMYHHSKEDSGLRAFDSSRAALLMNITPEPVEMTARHKREGSDKALWGGLSLLMVLVLFIQVAWLQFDNLNRTEPYRSFYESACSVIGCKLPTLVDRSKIRAYNLVVRNHPRLDNALIVDAILLNNASFQQPFPDLILAFSTIEDQPVASRRFKPQEYLRGELAGRSLMPQNQPVHLTLELVDPGSDAVNYHAYIPE